MNEHITVRTIHTDSWLLFLLQPVELTLRQKTLCLNYSLGAWLKGIVTFSVKYRKVSLSKPTSLKNPLSWPVNIWLGQWLTLLPLTVVVRFRSPASAFDMVYGHQIGCVFFRYTSFPAHIKTTNTPTVSANTPLWQAGSMINCMICISVIVQYFRLRSRQVRDMWRL